MLEGVDVSNYQPTIDWDAVAASGRRFAWCKASEGCWFQDHTFHGNWAALASRQMWRGAYHFGHPEQYTGHEEADYFCDYVLQSTPLPGDLYALDLEVGPPHADLAAYVVDFADVVEERLWARPFLYSASYMLHDWHLVNDANVARCPLWLAAWGPHVIPTAPPAWDRVDMWQYTDKGWCPGIGLCDLDQFNGSEDDLFAYGRP